LDRYKKGDGKMIKLKKRNVVLAELLCMCMLVGACAGQSAESNEEIIQKEIVQEQQEGAEIKEDQAETKEDQPEIKEDQSEIKLIPADKVNVTREEVQEGRELTAGELQAFGEYLSRSDNYGFLLSVYDTPADVDLGEVFYNGAGISSYEISENEKQAYLEANGQEEIYTDFVKITTDDINAFLKEKTGIAYDQMNTGLAWSYLPEYDAYYSEHGDTNYREIRCIEGYTVDENVYVLQCSPCDYDDSADGYHSMKYELVLEKYGEEYRFRSNRLMWELGLIEEQSFEVALEPLGNVIFAAYAPDQQKDVYADVSFSIIKDGWEMTRLLGLFPDNIRLNGRFNEIAGIGFADYNQDGITDIIMIINYSVLSDGDKETDYSEVRIYQGEYEEYPNDGFYYFQWYQPEISAEATVWFSEEVKTIRGVLDFCSSQENQLQ